MQLVPHYAEGVIYPLDSEEVAARIGDEVKKGDLGDELVEQMSGLDVSTIDFLRIQFRDEWDNFVQRIIGRYHLQGIVDPAKVTERDFRITEKGIFSGADLNKISEISNWQLRIAIKLQKYHPPFGRRLLCVALSGGMVMVTVLFMRRQTCAVKSFCGANREPLVHPMPLSLLGSLPSCTVPSEVFYWCHAVSRAGQLIEQLSFGSALCSVLHVMHGREAM